MKNSKKVFGLFAFLLVCSNVNAISRAPQEYPAIRHDYNNVNASLPTFSFTENLTNGGNYIRVIENSNLDIASTLDINLTSNIPSTGAYGNLVGFGAYGTNNGAPTINAKDVKIKVEAGAADYHNEPFGMLIRDGANYSGGNIDINLITNSNHSASDITALSYGLDNENVTREYNSTMKVKDVNIKIVNNQVLTNGIDDNNLIGLDQMGEGNQNTNFVSTGNLNIDIDDKSNSAPYHIAAGIVIEGDSGTKMTLNNSNIKIKSKTNNDYLGGAIVLGFPDYEATTTGQGTTLESKG